MNILMMTNTYTPIVGGLEKSVQTFSKEFQKKGHKVFIVAPRFKNMPKYERGVIRIPAIQKFQGTDFSVNLPIPGLLTKFIKRFQPDIVHSHHPFLVGDMALRISRSQQIPIVFTYHIMFEQYIDYLPIHNEVLKHFIVRLAAGYANLADAVIVPTYSVKNILKSRGVTAPMHVIPTGINVEAFKRGDGDSFRNKHQILNDAFVIGYIGRITPEKNLEFLAKSVVRYCKRNSNVHFLLAGQGPLLETIQSLFINEGLTDRLHYVGVLSHQELVDCYHAMDVFAFSSQSETQGIVMIEAMAAGIPVAALDGPVVSEFVKDFKNGRLIREQDEVQFAESFEWFNVLSASQLKKIKQEAVKTASKYSLSDCVEQTLKLYNDLSSDFVYKQKKNQMWYAIMSNLKIEVELIKNLIDAGEDAVKETFSRKKKSL